MEYYYIFDYNNKGEPLWKTGKAYGYRRKNKKDQVFVRGIDGMMWIYAEIVDVDPDKKNRK